MTPGTTAPAERAPVEALDLREKGAPRDGQPQFLDRRLFVQIQAFGGCRDPKPLIAALEKSGIEAALYADLNDPRGVAVAALSENPDLFLGRLRELLNAPPFSDLPVKPEYAMLGRTYSSGHETDLADWLLNRVRRLILDPDMPWALWYPLRRTGSFSSLPGPEQMEILGDHGRVGRRFGEAGLASDIRLASAGLDKNDNDFVIGVVGKKLHPLSALVAAMRKTRQTSAFIQSMGPFLVAKTLWQSPGVPAGHGKRP